jgi:pyrroloquinoline quinone biosynthesis protein B
MGRPLVSLFASRMRVRLLGTTAGGGLPQWNCRCANCQAARQRVLAEPSAIAPLAQCALAVSPDGVGWYLVNAPPDVTHQLTRWPELHPDSGIRSSPIRGVILTDGELDHILGLLHLREASRWTLYATAAVIAMLEDGLRVLPALRRYADIRVHPLPLRDALHLGDADAGMELRVVETGRRAPRYLGRDQHAPEGSVVAAVLTDRGSGKRVVHAPCVGALSETLRGRLEGAEVVFFDGTFWSDDELRDLGIGADTARNMGHIPVSGPEGSALWLSKLSAGAKLYVHLNNTNPLLDPSSQERAWVRTLGLEVAPDGWRADV